MDCRFSVTVETGFRENFCQVQFKNHSVGNRGEKRDSLKLPSSIRVTNQPKILGYISENATDKNHYIIILSLGHLLRFVAL